MLLEAKFQGNRPGKGRNAIFKKRSGLFVAIELPESHKNYNHLNLSVQGSKTEKDYVAKMKDKIDKAMEGVPKIKGSFKKDPWAPAMHSYMENKKVVMMLRAMVEDMLANANHVLLDDHHKRVGNSTVPLTDDDKKKARKKFTEKTKANSGFKSSVWGARPKDATTAKQLIHAFFPIFDYSFYFMVIDSRNRMIRVPVDDGKHFMHSRTSRDRDIVYTFPERGSQMDMRDVRNVVKTMMSMDKGVADWAVHIDEKVGDGPWRAGDWVAGRTASKSMNQITSMDKLFRTSSGEIKAYHGTSYKNWLDIKENGIKVNPNDYQYVDKVEGISDKGIYIALDPSVARRYATRDAGGRKAAVLEITLRDWSRIRVDEDSMISAFNRIQSNKKMRENLAKVLDDTLKRRWKEFKDEPDPWGDRKKNTKKPPLKDFLHQTLHSMLRSQNQGKELTKREQTVMNYLKNTAIYMNKREMTFQYAKPERIPKSDIKLKETFTSKQIRKDYSDQDVKTERMLGTFRLHDEPAGKPRVPPRSMKPSAARFSGMQPVPEGTVIDQERFLGMVKEAFGGKPKQKDMVSAFGISPPTLRTILTTGKVGRNASTKIVRGWNSLVSATK